MHKFLVYSLCKPALLDVIQLGQVLLDAQLLQPDIVHAEPAVADVLETFGKQHFDHFLD